MDNGFAQHITKTPGVCGGRPCIAGNSIRVQDVVVWHEMRAMSPVEIVAQFPGITLADVYAALVYYHDNRQEIEDAFRKEEELAEYAKANFPSRIPAALREQFGV